MARRIGLGIAFGALGASVGAWLGGRAYVWLGLGADGDLDQLAGYLEGALVGALAGVFIGSIVLGARGMPRGAAIGAAFACLAAAGLFGAGIWWVGAFTDADGPSGIEPWLGISMVPGAGVVVWITARAVARARRSSTAER